MDPFSEGIQTHVGHHLFSVETGLPSGRNVNSLQLEGQARITCAAQRLGISSGEMVKVCYHPKHREKAVKSIVFKAFFQ